jgi:uncharacterized protein
MASHDVRVLSSSSVVDPRSRRSAIVAGLVLLGLVASLVVYKTAGAMRQIEHARATGFVALTTGVVSEETSVLPLRVGARALNYLAVIWPALAFGILVSAGVRAFVPTHAVARAFSAGPVRGQLVAGASGAPLMLCSCCAAPLFSSVYEGSRRLGPSLALMLAAPALNPAALVLTFLLFPGPIAWARLAMSVAAVFVGTALVGRFTPEAWGSSPESRVAGAVVPRRTSFRGFVTSCLHVSVRTMPAIVVGIAAAMLFADRLHGPGDLAVGARVWIIALTAAVAVPLAVPTFFEIPLAVAFVASDAPLGAAAALLFAGPAVNMASLLTVAREAGWRAVGMVAVMVWGIAVLGGLLLPD